MLTKIKASKGGGVIPEFGKSPVYLNQTEFTGCIKTLGTDFNAAYYAIDPSIYREPSKMKSGQPAHVNLIWSPIRNVNAGIEYMVLQRINGSGDSGVGQRLQMMIK